MLQLEKVMASERDRKAALEVWDAIYSAGRVSQAFDQAGTAPALATEPDEVPEIEPMTAKEAGDHLGFSDARFRQIVRKRGIKPVGKKGAASLYAPEVVSMIALERLPDKSRVPGPDEPVRGTKAA
ncbi:hypothetical protein F7P69_01400 [Cellulosimicrobium funkei]|nr:hypothetical protein [Cellulosimicrobium funkei]